MFWAKNIRVLAVLIFVLCFPSFAVAQPFTLLRSDHFSASRSPLFGTGQGSLETGQPNTGASLFIGQTGHSLFAPFTPRRHRALRHVDPIRNATRVERIRALIGQAESGRKSYDAVQHGAVISPPKPPTEMTIQEIYNWIVQTPGQQHAIGRYQFIPATLKRLVTKLGLAQSQVFSPQIQDRLGDILLIEAGFNAFDRGDIERHAFMNNLARIWAGLPTSSGKSYYDGVAGNQATMTWAYFDQEMARIFPD